MTDIARDSITSAIRNHDSEDGDDAIRGNGLATEEDVARAKHIIKKNHERGQERLAGARKKPFNKEHYRKDIRDLSGTLRRLKVAHGEVEPGSPDEVRLANKEGEAKSRMLRILRQQLPGGADIAHAAKTADGSPEEHPHNDGRDPTPGPDGFFVTTKGL